jgi:hypothetical protein
MITSKDMYGITVDTISESGELIEKWGKPEGKVKGNLKDLWNMAQGGIHPTLKGKIRSGDINKEHGEKDINKGKAAIVKMNAIKAIKNDSSLSKSEKKKAIKNAKEIGKADKVQAKVDFKKSKMDRYAKGGTSIQPADLKESAEFVCNMTESAGSSNLNG